MVLAQRKEAVFTIKVTAATHKLDAYNKYYLAAGDQKVPLILEETGGMNKWKEFEAGPITLPAGNIELVLGCRAQLHVSDIAISTITLKPE